MAGQGFWRGLAALTVLGGGTLGYFAYSGQAAPYPLSEIPYFKDAVGKLATLMGTAPKPTVASAPASGPAGGGRPPVPVTVGKAERKPMPVRLDVLGTVQTMATVSLRARVESQIMAVNFKDGASVNAGDTLFRLDSRQMEAQIRQAEANLARDRAQAASNDADFKRATELARRDFASEQRLDQAKALSETQRAVVRASEANIDNLKVQLSYYTLIAPISGRVGTAGLKEGNVAKTGDGSPVLATINQTSPIYVAFSVPQRYLIDIKTAVADTGSSVVATPQGLTKSATGRVAFVDNAVDGTTGTIVARAIFENADEMLWPGALVNARVILRTEPDALVVPREAVQTGQTGTFVFVAEGDVVRVRPVVVNRVMESQTVLTSGLTGNETVVTDGHLLLTNGARIVVRQPGQRPQGAPPGAPPAAGNAPVGGAPSAGQPAPGAQPRPTQG
ncbi:MAG: efflux RND transporter periplasmic adaptor subunit [Bosea sp. (in: a-proteobacteria)]